MIERDVVVAGVRLRITSSNPHAGPLLDARFGAFTCPARPEEGALRLELAMEGARPRLAADGAPMGLSARAGGGWQLSTRTSWADISGAGDGAVLRGELAGQPIDAALRLLLARRLVRDGGLLVHASAVVLGGQAHLFVGPSGSGKSTVARLLPGELLSDEAVALRPGGSGEWLAEGTPYWNGRPLRAPLGGLFFLRRGGPTGFTPLPAARAAQRLLAATGPLLPGALGPALENAARLISSCRYAGVSLAHLDDISGWLHPRLLRQNTGDDVARTR